MSSESIRHRGIRLYRFRDNPLEQKFSDVWKAENDRGQLLEYLLGDGNKRASVTERDETVAATVIQWLGTPVGQSFVKKVMGLP